MDTRPLERLFLSCFIFIVDPLHVKSHSIFGMKYFRRITMRSTEAAWQSCKKKKCNTCKTAVEWAAVCIRDEGFFPTDDVYCVPLEDVRTGTEHEHQPVPFTTEVSAHSMNLIICK